LRRKINALLHEGAIGGTRLVQGEKSKREGQRRNCANPKAVKVKGYPRKTQKGNGLLPGRRGSIRVKGHSYGRS